MRSISFGSLRESKVRDFNLILKMAALSNGWQGPASKQESVGLKWPVDEGVVCRQRPES